MKVLVDYDLCEANGLCMECCPTVFRLEDDDSLTVMIPEEFDNQLTDQINQAAELCPRQAITVT